MIAETKPRCGHYSRGPFRGSSKRVDAGGRPAVSCPNPPRPSPATRRPSCTQRSSALRGTSSIRSRCLACSISSSSSVAHMISPNSALARPAANQAWRASRSAPPRRSFWIRSSTRLASTAQSAPSARSEPSPPPKMASSRKGSIPPPIYERPSIWMIAGLRWRAARWTAGSSSPAPARRPAPSVFDPPHLQGRRDRRGRYRPPRGTTGACGAGERLPLHG